jgi:SAM-dependent methyltransferase
MVGRLAGQTPAWYDRLSALQDGYYYPWRSELPAMHGEDAYLGVVRAHARADVDVLDVACGHGGVALDVATRARSVLGYDRTAAWVELARRAAAERGLTNAAFLCHDSSPEANGGRARLPAEDGSFDLLICSKGPLHWIEDARRVARPGAVLLMLVPDARPVPPWYGELPEALRWGAAPDPDWARPAVEKRLADVGLALDSWWSFDVPEVFPDAEQVYGWLTFGATAEEVPTFARVRRVLARIFLEHGGRDGLVVRRRRYLWKAIVRG